MVKKNNLKRDLKIAIVTGAGGLLGFHHCVALLEIGYYVYACDLNKNSLERIKKFSEKNGFVKKVLPYEMNVTNINEVEDLARHIIGKFGQIDALINNAAVNPKVDIKGLNNSGRLEDLSLPELNFEMDVGLISYIVFSKIFGKMMAKQGFGSIVNIASDLSVIAPDQNLYKKNNEDLHNSSKKPVSYSVIKHGVVGLTKYIASYYGYCGVRCNAISPGGVYVDQPKEFVDMLIEKIPLRRMARPDEYKGVIKFLCSDDSSYMTGHNLIVDGGRSII